MLRHAPRYLFIAVRTAILAGLAALVAWPQTAEARKLLCHGSDPGFSLTIENGSEVAFDYLGDGTFTLDPPLPPVATRSDHSLITARSAFDVTIETRRCRTLSATLPVRLEVRVPTMDGPMSMPACCLWSD
ncbi:hypothetical protein AAD018_007975 [Aestuariibius insulae]|uniref:hypothetical protein n=1 Tax=Aestuariibius insulae TaxID=2058287 RepID=UPI00345E5FB6